MSKRKTGGQESVRSVQWEYISYSDDYDDDDDDDEFVDHEFCFHLPIRSVGIYPAI